eukprot:1773819-Rhodomonas_salina.1
MGPKKSVLSSQKPIRLGLRCMERRSEREERQHSAVANGAGQNDAMAIPRPTVVAGPIGEGPDTGQGSN